MAKIEAFALFFEDLREEVGNKISLMGQYTGALVANASDSRPVDRLVIIVIARWKFGASPKDPSILLEMGDQKPQRFAVPDDLLRRHSTTPPKGEKSVIIEQTNLQLQMVLRNPSLRIGDTVAVWFEADGKRYAAGTLDIQSAVPEDELTPRVEAAASQRQVGGTSE